MQRRKKRVERERGGEEEQDNPRSRLSVTHSPPGLNSNYFLLPSSRTTHDRLAADRSGIGSCMSHVVWTSLAKAIGPSGTSDSIWFVRMRFFDWTGGGSDGRARFVRPFRRNGWAALSSFLDVPPSGGQTPEVLPYPHHSLRNSSLRLSIKPEDLTLSLVFDPCRSPRGPINLFLLSATFPAYAHLGGASYRERV